ncbi:octopine/nopaline transport system permease protein [Faunimonas pinastri]|uniref:Octopine/nopaline transport system permease protein n=1 Tax=Faunimonas pinastri TaxID=1855383 RepID=A0A1H9KA92_9HYPH|nr:ABC transporter permease subunit [Faunimonas pinastri]SEQ95847.1 octopine/nopaline transport system permease protein [Faunimonas pinastri]
MDRPDLIDLISFGPDGWGYFLLSGTAVTVLIAVSGYAIGAAIGVIGAWAKVSGGRTARIVAEVYTTTLRGIPDLLVIYLIYFGGSALISAVARLMGAQGFVGVPGFLAGALAVGITSGAQQTEVLRGGFLAVSKGELEAATAYGMPGMLKLRRIIVPLTLRHSLPGLGNVWQVVLKESALVSVTGAVELMRQTQIAAGSTRLPFDFYLIAAMIYLLISCASGLVFGRSEARLSRGTRRA